LARRRSRRRLDDDLVAALVELRKRQGHESAVAGAAYGAGLAELDWYTEGDKYIVTDELGTPLHPESYSDEFTRMLKRAGLPRIRLHDSRHTTLSLLEKAGRSYLDHQQVGGSL
jgi:integrase